MSFIVSFFYLLQTKPIETSSPDWGMFGVVLGIVSLLAAILIGTIQIKAAERPKKDIKCFVVSIVPLLEFDDKFKSQLQVSFQGKIVQDPTFVILRVYNSGKIPITPSDFIRPIIFMFGVNTEIINAEILETEPDNIGAKISVSRNSIELQPLLLNSEDSIDISTIVTLFDKNITIDGRVVDIKTIKILDKKKEEEVNDLKRQKLLLRSMNIVSIFSIITSFIALIFILLR
jgi:hypothetical protein